MKQLLSCALAAALLGGCMLGTTSSKRRTYAESKSAAQLGGFAVAAGLLILGASALYRDQASRPPSQDLDLLLTAAFVVPVMILPGTIALAEGLSGMSEPRTDEPARDRERAALAARMLARDNAWMLTKEAAAAARAGDCSTTTSLAVRVRRLDAEFHGSVLARDVAIRRCLQLGRSASSSHQVR